MNDWIGQFGLTGFITVFLAAGLAILLLGTRLTGISDRLADRTGIGEALTGAVLLGAVTSLPGSVLSVAAALKGNADLALGNAFGGIAAQTLFLVVADAVYRRANLEHAAASVENLMQATLLVCMLALLQVAVFSPDWTWWGVHPVTPVMLAGYAYGITLVRRGRTLPMWQPKQTRETRQDVPDEDYQRSHLATLVTGFVVMGLLLAVSGWLLQIAATGIVDATGLDPAIMGALFTSITTSLPELVTTLAAVRRGALTLAFSIVLGGNAYDTLFAAFADLAYREGSVYHAIDPLLSFWVAVSMLMTGVLILGMLVRERRGIANIGFESFLVLLFYATAAATLLLQRL